MNAQDVAELVSIVRTLYPAQRFDDNPTNVIRAWGLVVADLDLDEARAAVVRLARRGQQWCSPGDVRREVAAARNVLTPDADTLLSDVRAVASKQGEGRRMLHPAARHVYDAIGGSEAIRRFDSHGLTRLRRQLEDAAAKYDEHQLTSDVLPAAQPPALPVARRLELEARSDDAQKTSSPMPAHLREQLNTIGRLP